MPISNLDLDSFGYANKDAKRRAAIEKLEATKKQKVDSKKGTGKLVGGALGALAAGIATGGNPQAIMSGFGAGGSLGSIAGGAIAGDIPSTEDITSAIQAGMSVPGIGEAIGMEGATEGSSISGALKNKEQISKIKKLYSSGTIDKTKYDQLMSLLSM